MARALFVFGLLFASTALACATCGAGGTPNDPNQSAYKLMTFVMSFTPLIAIGSIGFFVYWRVRRHDEQPPSPPPSPPPAPATVPAQRRNASA
jgi:hypothetical protein